jgi:hypothetical protein
VETLIITAVLAFLLGMAVGIAGYAYTTLFSWEKEVEAIFQRMCERYQKKIDNLNAENDRLHESVLSLQVQLARKEKRS